METAKQAGGSSFGEMVDYLHKHPEPRFILVEKTDRLYRNLKDWVTRDELNLEIHFVKENIALSAAGGRFPTLREVHAHVSSGSPPVYCTAKCNGPLS